MAVININRYIFLTTVKKSLTQNTIPKYQHCVWNLESGCLMIVDRCTVLVSYNTLNNKTIYL